MTDIAFAPAPARRSALAGVLLGSLLAALATVIALSVLPEPRSVIADPTPVEVWHGNVAHFGS